MKLGNFYYDCEGCTYTLHITDTAQVQQCPQCGREVRLSPAYQQFLIDERARIQARSHAEQLQI